MGAKSIDLDLDTLEGAGGYAREMTEDRAARQRELLTPFIAAADALITTAAVPGPPGADAGHPRDGRADEARLGRRRPRLRERRQRRGLGGRRGGPDRQRPGLGRPQRAQPDAGPGLQALRPEHRQPGHLDDRARTTTATASSPPTSPTRSSPAAASPTTARSSTSRPARRSREPRPRHRTRPHRRRGAGRRAARRRATAAADDDVRPDPAAVARDEQLDLPYDQEADQ